MEQPKRLPQNIVVQRTHTTAFDWIYTSVTEHRIQTKAALLSSPSRYK
ncbi:hypothetical protein Q3V23_34470 [Streptomyces sp. VNUA116]|nr:hypothetical protein [Streptomyces sp. VNUA116]WKU48759.1 hypothetical protein Q3V23_34470 [Streptomyces sp. VNUA116]